jgi:O-antigen ligase
VVVAFALLVRYLYAAERPPDHSRTFRIEFFLIFYFVVVAASFLVASDQERARAAILGFGKDLIIIYCILFALRRSVEWKQTIWLMIITCAVLASLSTYQFLTNNHGQTFFEFASITVSRVAGDAPTPRAGGPVNAPNIWAQILVAVSMLLIFRILQERRLFVKLAGVLILGMIVYTVLNTYSRAAYLVLVIDLILILLILKRHVNPFAAFAGLAALFVLFQFLPAAYQARINTLLFFTSDNGIYQDSSFRGRSSEMLTGLAMFSSHPVLGVGASNYRPNYQQYTQLIGLEFRAEERDPHSLYVQVLAETGILGALAFFGLIYALLDTLNKACLAIEQTPRLREWLPWMNSIRMAIISYLLTSFFMHDAYFRYFWILVAMALTGIQITYNLLNNAERSTAVEARS